MTTEIYLPALHESQQEVEQCRSRFVVLVTGRRWGKTVFGVSVGMATALQGGRVWWVAPSYKMSNVGWRMIKELAVQLPFANVNKSDRIVSFPSGGSFQVRSGHEPDALRGEGLDLAILDECAYMKSEVWTDSIRPALSDRKGRALFISTPKGGNWFSNLYKYAYKRNDSIWQGFKFTSYANPYLDSDEIDSAKDTQSNRLFRQEYLAEILDDVPGALWTRAIIDAVRIMKAPDMRRIVVAIDPAVTSNEDSDMTGIIVAGIGDDGNGYTLEDVSMKGTPRQWARAAITAYYKYNASLIVAETNNGGDMIEHTIRTEDANISFKQVRASRGKHTRAEPVSALYEHKKIHHVGIFTELENQLCTWTPGDDSPDRLDALVWAFTELMLGTQWRVSV